MNDDKTLVVKRPCGCAVILATEWAMEKDKSIRRNVSKAIASGCVAEWFDTLPPVRFGCATCKPNKTPLFAE